MARRKTCPSPAGEALAPAGAAFPKAADFGGKRTIRREKRPPDYLEFIGALLPALSRSQDSPADDIADRKYAKVLGAVQAAMGEQAREEVEDRAEAA